MSDHATGHFEAIVRSSDDAIISKSLDGTVLSWNAGAERIYGYTAEEMVGQPIAKLVPSDRPDEVPAILGTIRYGGRVDHYETKRVTRDGRVVDVSLTISPIQNGAGEIVGASTIARDITVQKELEAALAALNDDLRRSNQELDEFAAVVAHDLVGPLQITTGYLELVLQSETSLSSETRTWLERALGGVLRASALAQDVLAHARAGANAESTLVDLGALAVDVVDTVCRRHAARAPAIEIGPLPDVCGVREQLNQVLVNLIDNAVKYCPPERQPKVRLDGSVDGAIAKIRVADNGGGIRPAEREVIFDMLVRGQDVAVDGTGVGLAICRRVAEAHGGSIEVADSPLGGAMFVVSLPLEGVRRP